MNPVHLETLLAIVDEGSFDVAAAVLGISPSAVSQRIKALESSTGRVLLRRATPVTATEAGEILVQSARRMALVQAETDARLGHRLDAEEQDRLVGHRHELFRRRVGDRPPAPAACRSARSPSACPADPICSPPPVTPRPVSAP